MINAFLEVYVNCPLEVCEQRDVTVCQSPEG